MVVRHGLGYCSGWFAAIAGIVWIGVVAHAQPPGDGLTFEKDIRPILRAHCWDCHGANTDIKGGLDLRLVRFALRGGDSGPAIVPGKPGDSLLIQRIRAGEMPPTERKVTPAELSVLEKWIAVGAPTLRSEPEELPPGVAITPEDRQHWAFRPIQVPPVPPPEQWGVSAERMRTPIDVLLQSSMPKGLTFAPDADRRTLIRRAYLDLIGLPPTPEEVEQFASDPRPDAYEHLVDKLLASPHYGERWARHWLDVAGYADSEGGNADDPVRPWAFRYRDYVIDSLNDDKPFDQFLMEQLAGDELAGAKQGEWTARQIELLTATGFLRMAADPTVSNNSPESRNQTIADTIRILGSALFGLTLNCAQCHDHRYDPVPQRDYYAIRAVFAPALDPDRWLVPSQRLVSLYTEADRQRAAEIEQQVQTLLQEKNQKQEEYLVAALEQELMKYEQSVRDALRVAYKTRSEERTEEQKKLLEKYPSVNITPGVLYQYNQAAADDLKKYDQRVAELRGQKPTEEFIHALVEPSGHLPVTRRLHRGDPQQPQEEVPPGVLQVLMPESHQVEIPVDDAALPTSGRRVAFARWLVSGENPLTPRVLVNRIWMHHFGRGIVDTPGDFGRLGSLPSHPELLDWLAHFFITNGWSLKKLHRVIMLSTAYRQASSHPEAMAGDPDNRYYTRKPLWRLEAEAICDRMLAVSGQLEHRLYGAPLPIKEDETGQVIVEGNQRRRSLYIQVRRTRPVAMLQIFDAPVMEVNCERRVNSTAATQALMLLNGAFILEQARAMAERVEREIPAAGSLSERLEACAVRAWQLAFARPPTESERTVLRNYLTEQQQYYCQGAPLPENTTVEIQVLANLCHTLMAADEFLYVD